MLGRLPNDEQAPREAIIDNEPCEDCQESMSKGITLIGVSEKPASPNQSPMTYEPHALYFSGKWCVMCEEAVPDAFDKTSKEIIDSILMVRKAFVDDKIVAELIETSEELNEE